MGFQEESESSRETHKESSMWCWRSAESVLVRRLEDAEASQEKAVAHSVSTDLTGRLRHGLVSFKLQQMCLSLMSIPSRVFRRTDRSKPDARHAVPQSPQAVRHLRLSSRTRHYTSTASRRKRKGWLV